MESIVIYNINFAVITLLFFLFFRNKGVFQWNRWILIAIPFISLLVSLIQFNNVESIKAFQVHLPAIGVSTTTVENTLESNTFSWIQWTLIAGIIISLIFHTIELFKLNRLFAESTLIKVKDDYKVYDSKFNASFGKSIFIQTEADPEIQRLVFEHEKAHIKQRHTVDRLFANVIQTLSWFNPVVYIWQDLIIKNHEFLADEYVLKKNSRKKYSTFLLQQQLQSNQPLTIRPLSQMSHLKNRIMRMKKANSLKKAGLQYVLIPIGVFALTVLNISAKNFTKAGVENPIQKELQTEEPDVYPEFPGGQEAMMTYIQENLVYPKDAREKGIEGKVFVSFVVTKKGHIKNVKVMKGTDSSLDQAAVKVVSSMPKWTPGKKDGKNINTEMTLPLMYKLPKKTEEE